MSSSSFGAGLQDHSNDSVEGRVPGATSSVSEFQDSSSFAAIPTTGAAAATTSTEPRQSSEQEEDEHPSNDDESPPSDDIDTSVAKLGSDDDDDVARVVAEAIKKEAISDAVGGGGDQRSATGGESGGTAASNPINGDDEETTICQPVSDTPTHRRTNSDTNRKKRLCRYPGCTKVIKSQGHCQRHGAKAKRCKVEGCEKQAQGTHDGMCKRHWRAVHFPDQVAAKAEAARKKELEQQPPPPFGESVYDNVLPASIAYRPSFASHQFQMEKAANANAVSMAGLAKEDPTDNPLAPAPTADGKPSSIVSAMPLVNFLRDGALHKEVGWHRQAERRARGILQCSSLGVQLEPWEKQLALVEILLLSGGTPHANFKDLAYAWGREKGFHQVLSASVCTRRGEVERKKRSDAGKKSGPRQPSNSNHHGGVPHSKRAKVEAPTRAPMPTPAPTPAPAYQLPQTQHPMLPPQPPQKFTGQMVPTEQSYQVHPWLQQQPPQHQALQQQQQAMQHPMTDLSTTQPPPQAPI